MRGEKAMASINFDEIDYSELVTFITVAETMNMSIAADKLCITQPAVSKRIANLENKYGIILFVRAGRKLQITPAGKELYHELIKSMEHLHQAFIKAADVQATPVRTLRLAYDGFFDIPLLCEITKRYEEKNPNNRISLYSYAGEDCTDLFDGKADIMMCPVSYQETVARHTNSETISSFQFSVLVSRDHPLSAKTDISVHDLAGIPLTAARYEDTSPYLTAVRKIFTTHGISPRFDHFVQREHLLFELVTENGIAIASPGFWRRLNARTASYFEERIKVFPLEDQFLPMGFLWRADEDQNRILRFIDVYHEVAEEGNNREIIDDAYR